MRIWAPACRAVALLLGPYAEVVLHDPGPDRVPGIWHPMTRRKPGDPSLPGEPEALDPAARDVYGPDEKLLADAPKASRSPVYALLAEHRDRRTT